MGFLLDSDYGSFGVAAFKDDSKFIAARARNQVFVAHTAAQAAGDGAEKIVAGGDGQTCR
jgi:hypothetical protein